MTDKTYTKGIVLSRTDFSEADRVISLLTESQGKLHLMAKGVRKPTSKLAGGIELFCEVEVGYVKGRGELGTLVSSRLIKFYKNILEDITKVQVVYFILKTLDRVTEDNAEPDYYILLKKVLTLANESNIKSETLDIYFKAQILKLSGHMPNLISDVNNDQLSEKNSYNFDLNAMSMTKANSGKYKQAEIKYLRLLFDDRAKVFNVAGTDSLALAVKPLIDAMMKQTLSI